MGGLASVASLPLAALLLASSGLTESSAESERAVCGLCVEYRKVFIPGADGRKRAPIVVGEGRDQRIIDNPALFRHQSKDSYIDPTHIRLGEICVGAIIPVDVPSQLTSGPGEPAIPGAPLKVTGVCYGNLVPLNTTLHMELRPDRAAITQLKQNISTLANANDALTKRLDELEKQVQRSRESSK